MLANNDLFLTDFLEYLYTFFMNMFQSLLKLTCALDAGLYVVFALVLICPYNSASVLDIESLPMPISEPGLKAPRKLWWAKEITPDYHVAGRLTDRQIKYASEAGFKSILSLFFYGHEEGGNFGGEYLPTSAEANVIASRVVDIQYVVLLEPEDDWASVAAERKLTEMLPKLQKPVLLHCNRGYTIAFVALMHLANMSRQDPSFQPQINSKRFYEITASMGLDFTMDFTKETVSKITGEEIVADPPLPGFNPSEWMDYWFARPLYKNWFVAGQIREYHIPVLEATGFKTIINTRTSFEHVTLLNINDTGRKFQNNLEKFVLDKNRETSYISGRSEENYENQNTGEYGDKDGYRERFERNDVRHSKLAYHYMPIDSTRGYSYDLFAKYKDDLVAAGESGPVLLHCARGKRATYIGILAAAVQYDKSLDWALARSRHLGYPVDIAKTPDVYEMYKSWLTKKKNVHQEL